MTARDAPALTAPDVPGGDRDRDRRRLDWLEARGWLHVYVLIGEDGPDRRQLVVPGDTLIAPPVRASGPTLRAAIDAAMAEWAVHGEGGSVS